MAIAANKSDIYENEEVEDAEGTKFAQEINAIFQKTSAKQSSGIDDLFRKIGIKIVNPQSENNAGQSGNSGKNITKTNDKNKVSLSQKNAKGKKKGFC